jgi:hypothetical protein
MAPISTILASICGCVALACRRRQAFDPKTDIAFFILDAREVADYFFEPIVRI